MTTMRRGFTLIELMVVGAIAVVLLLLAAPSFRQMIEMQRLRAVGAQVVTDIQYARSEAPSRQRKVYFRYVADGTSPSGVLMSCYILYTCPTDDACSPCTCTAAVGNRCTNGAEELRTQQVERSLGVRLSVVPAGSDPRPSVLSFEPATGGLELYYSTPLGLSLPGTGTAWIESALLNPELAPTLRTEVAVSGRPNMCAPGGRVSGVAACATP